MDDISYDPQSRSRLCGACGASNSAPMAGGELTCVGCGVAISVPPRVLQPLGEPLPAGGEPPAAQQARVDRLRRQADAYNRSNPYATARAPEGLEDLAYVDEVEDLTLQLVLQRYRQTLESCLSRSSAPTERQLYWLTNKLNNIYAQRAESVKAWGAIQTSMDALSEEGYQHILRCMSADKARKAEQLDHAEAWLALCDPTPRILELDYNYRSAKAMLHAARGQWAEALALVGESNDDVPFPPAGRLVKGCLRVTALEQLQRPEAAEKAMGELLVATGSLQSTLLRMCRPGNLYAPVTRVWGRVDRKTGGRKRLVIMAVLVAFALGLGVFGGVLLTQSRYYSGWRGVEAKIVRVHSREIMERGHARIGVGVDYSYDVNGKTYTGSRVTHDSRYYTFQSGHKAEREMARLRARTTINAYYDPANPRRSVIERAATESYLYAVLAWAGTIILLLVALLILRMHLRRRRSLSARPSS